MGRDIEGVGSECSTEANLVNSIVVFIEIVFENLGGSLHSVAFSRYKSSDSELLPKSKRTSE